MDHTNFNPYSELEKEEDDNNLNAKSNVITLEAHADSLQLVKHQLEIAIPGLWLIPIEESLEISGNRARLGFLAHRLAIKGENPGLFPADQDYADKLVHCFRNPIESGLKQSQINSLSGARTKISFDGHSIKFSYCIRDKTKGQHKLREYLRGRDKPTSVELTVIGENLNTGKIMTQVDGKTFKELSGSAAAALSNLSPLAKAAQNSCAHENYKFTMSLLDDDQVQADDHSSFQYLIDSASNRLLSVFKSSPEKFQEHAQQNAFLATCINIDQMVKHATKFTKGDKEKPSQTTLY